MLNQALAICEAESIQGLGKADYQDLGGVLNDTAVCQAQLGEWKGAEIHLKRALYMGERAQSPDVLLMVATHTNLGEVYGQMGALGKAEAHLRQATTWLSKQVAKGKENASYCIDRATLAAVHGSLGRVRLLQGHEQDAVHLLQDAVSLSERSIRHPVYGKSLSNLALFHLQQHNGSIAEKLLRLARTALKRTVGIKHLDMVICLNNLACVAPLSEVTHFKKPELIVVQPVEVFLGGWIIFSMPAHFS